MASALTTFVIAPWYWHGRREEEEDAWTMDSLARSILCKWTRKLASGTPSADAASKIRLLCDTFDEDEEERAQESNEEGYELIDDDVEDGDEDENSVLESSSGE